MRTIRFLLLIQYRHITTITHTRKEKKISHPDGLAHHLPHIIYQATQMEMVKSQLFPTRSAMTSPKETGELGSRLHGNEIEFLNRYFGVARMQALVLVSLINVTFCRVFLKFVPSSRLPDENKVTLLKSRPKYYKFNYNNYFYSFCIFRFRQET